MPGYADLTHAAALVTITGGAGAISPDNTRTKGCSVAKTGGNGEYTVTLAEYIDQRESVAEAVVYAAAGLGTAMTAKVTSQTDTVVTLQVLTDAGAAQEIPDGGHFSFALTRIAVG